MEEATNSMAHPLDSETRHFYLHAMAELDRWCIPYVVGGGYAMACHTGICRQTKDLDLFVRQSDIDRTLDVAAAAGYKTERTWPHFLVKILQGSAFIDVLHNSGNGLCAVDDEWLEHAEAGELLGRRIPLCPAEEMIWSKAYVQERDRYDGADIAHIILFCGRRLDWTRVIRRFAGNERVLLAHLILFGYVFPSERDCVPDWAIDELSAKARGEPMRFDRICRGSFLSKSQYQPDIEKHGFDDARLRPKGPFTAEQVAETEA